MSSESNAIEKLYKFFNDLILDIEDFIYNLKYIMSSSDRVYKKFINAWKNIIEYIREDINFNDLQNTFLKECGLIDEELDLKLTMYYNSRQKYRKNLPVEIRLNFVNDEKMKSNMKKYTVDILKKIRRNGIFTMDNALIIIDSLKLLIPGLEPISEMIKVIKKYKQQNPNKYLKSVVYYH